jgi:TonB-linked SusC/RagA family outer membrane protein
MQYALPFKNVLLTVIILFAGLLAAAQVEISGTVSDADTGDPLIGTTIAVKGTPLGTISDVDGAFQLSIPSADSTLVFSYIGYQPQEYIPGNRRVFDVQLEKESLLMDEVVVVGYGVQKKSDITGAVASINKDRLEKIPTSNLGQVLQGAVPGLSITQSSAGADPSSQRILLRGESSISASNTPLIVVDGVPINGDQTNDATPLFVLSDFNQQDIESVEVLKDATSAAIYGARAANGVILITTKKGRKGRSGISYDAYYGVENLASKPDLMNAQEFYDFRVLHIDSSIITPTEQANIERGVDTDWVDEALRQGQSQSHTLRLDGGTEQFNYYFSGNYQSIEGIAKNDKYDKISLRANLQQDVGDWLTVGTNTQITLTYKSGAAADFGSDRGAFYHNPMVEPYDSLGNLVLYPWPEQGYFRNPLVPLNYVQDDKTRRIFSNNFLELRAPWVKGLSYRLNTGYILSLWNFSEYRGRNTDDGLAQNGIAFNRTSVNSDILLENIVKYSQSFGNHFIDLTGLYSWQTIENDYRSQEAQGFISDALTYYQTDVATLMFANASYRKQNYLSQMFRLNYTFDSRYLFTFTVRRDGYSGFGENRKFGIFPSAAIGWNLSNESFLRNNEVISQLKLRLSYGLNGNQAVPAYSTVAQNRVIDFWGPDEGAAYGYYPQFLGNEDLGWESSSTFNLGIDFGFFRDRLNGSVEMYHTNTYDLLLYRSISTLHGFEPTVLTNIGETQNRGIELSLNVVPVTTSDFTWTLNFNASHNQNKILDLYGNGEDDVNNQWFIGQPLRVNFGYQFDGVFQEGDDIENSPQPDAEPGYVKIADTNGDGTISADDRVILSNQQPDLIGGISNTLEYKNWTFSFFFHFIQGVIRANPYKDFGRVWGEAQRNTIYQEFWTPENPINTYPKNDPKANAGYGVRFYEDASFLRMKDITLSYDFSKSWLKRININRLRVYGSGQNLLTVTEWTGLDPELDGQSSIPLTRKFIVGINVSF